MLEWGMAGHGCRTLQPVWLAICSHSWDWQRYSTVWPRYKCNNAFLVQEIKRGVSKVSTKYSSYFILKGSSNHELILASHKYQDSPLMAVQFQRRKIKYNRQVDLISKQLVIREEDFSGIIIPPKLLQDCRLTPLRKTQVPTALAIA